MAKSYVRSDSLDVRVCSETLLGYSSVTKDVVKITYAGLVSLATGVTKIPTDHKEDSEKNQCAIIIKSVEDTYDSARCYIGECCRLAGFINREEEATITAVRRGKVEKFKSFVDTLFYRSNLCQRELRGLIERIEKTEIPLLNEYEAIVQANSDGAKKKAIGGAAGIVGGGGAIATGLTAAGTATIVTFATSLGPQAPLTIPVGLTVAIGSFFFAAAGGAAIGAVAGTSALVVYYKKKMAAYKELIDVLRDMKKSLENIEHSLIDVHEQLKLMMNNNLKEMTNRTFKRVEQRNSIPNTLRTIAVQARQLKEYCQPLMNATTLAEFSKTPPKIK